MARSAAADRAMGIRPRVVTRTQTLVLIATAKSSILTGRLGTCLATLMETWTSSCLLPTRAQEVLVAAVQLILALEGGHEDES